MRLIATGIDGLVIAESASFSDERGAFTRLFCERELSTVLGSRHIVQINRSLTRSVGVVRGMHFQGPPHAEMKFVRCLRGRVWDVAVDLRRGSRTFLRWHAEELTPQNGRMIVIPEGFAHGFQVLEKDSELLYLHTQFYAPGTEGGISPLDPRVAIPWPREVSGLSERDQSHPPISDDFEGIDR